MLIWVNGPFGGGKTVTAFELARRLDSAVVCDPEYVGLGLHRMLPAHLRGDFQDLVAWRAGVVEGLDRVLTHQVAYGGHVVAPMTLVEPAYVEEVLGGLRALGHRVHHVVLLPERAEVVRRLRLRSIRGRRHGAWALERLDGCLERLASQEDAVLIHPGGASVEAIADAIAESAGLRLRPGGDGRLVAWARRTTTSVRHVRIDLAP